MALSGTINGAFGGTAASNVKPVIEWKATQNIGKNTSTVTATLVFIKSNSYWYPFNLSGHNVSMGINGNNASSSRTFDLRSKSREVVWSRSVTVAHNADGKKTINLSASGATGTNMGSYNISQNVELNTIPRASSMTIAPTTVDFGGTVKFNIARASGDFTHTINYNINGQAGNVITKTASTTPSWTVPLDLIKYSPTSTSAKITIWLDTYSGNTKIGVVQYSITANVPASIVPSISSFAAVEGESRMGVLKLAANNFLQGNSQIKFTSSATAGQGASLAKTTIAIDGVSSFEGTSGTIGLVGLASHSGAKTARVTVTDSRGRSAVKTLGITIHAYSPPKIALFETKRNNTNVNVKKSCTYTAIGANTITYSLTRAGNIKVGDLTHAQNDYTFGGYAINQSFVFTLTVNDLLNGATSVSTVSTGKQLMHIDKDAGFGIGKYREKGIMDILGDVWIDGGLDVKRGSTFNAGLKINGTTTTQNISNSGAITTGSIKSDGVVEASRIITSRDNYSEVGGGLHLGNSDIVGINGMYFNDPVDAHGEGLMFPRSGTEIPANGIVSDNKYPKWDNLRILDGNVHLNGRVVLVENVSEALWEGGMHMMAGHKIAPKKNINDCPNGWALVWVRWISGADAGYGYSWNYIHKRHSWGGGIYCPIAIGDDAFRTKYMYVLEGGKILGGNDANNKNGRDGAVLKGVYAW